MSQTELSRRTGIATSTISDWRKKQINPQADKLVSICKALDSSAGWSGCRTSDESASQSGDGSIAYIIGKDKKMIMGENVQQLVAYCRDY